MKQEDTLGKKVEVYAGIEKIELGEDDKIMLGVSTIYGDYNLELKGDLELSIKLQEGELLEADLVLVPSCLTDFIGQKPGKDDVVTASYVIDSLRIPNGELIYQRKKSKNGKC